MDERRCPHGPVGYALLDDVNRFRRGDRACHRGTRCSLPTRCGSSSRRATSSCPAASPARPRTSTPGTSGTGSATGRTTRGPGSARRCTWPRTATSTSARSPSGRTLTSRGAGVRHIARLARRRRLLPALPRLARAGAARHRALVRHRAARRRHVRGDRLGRAGRAVPRRPPRRRASPGRPGRRPARLPVPGADRAVRRVHRGHRRGRRRLPAAPLRPAREVAERPAPAAVHHQLDAVPRPAHAVRPAGPRRPLARGAGRAPGARSRPVPVHRDRSTRPRGVGPVPGARADGRRRERRRMAAAARGGDDR
jgi:hypothetical protein